MKPTDINLTHVQDNTTFRRVSQLRRALDKYREAKLKDNKTTTPTPDLQQALFKATRVGNINLMIEFILHGANPFAVDENNLDAISYAMDADPIKTGNNC